MRVYMATTMHYVRRGEFSVSSSLLAIERFTGSHTGERIAEAFETVMDTYDIRHKIDHIDLLEKLTKFIARYLQ